MPDTMQAVGASSLRGRLIFNVGGKLFETTEQTIRRLPGTRLVSLLDEMPGEQEFFIDHDPRYFDVILNFLRNRSFNVDYAEEFVDDLEREAKYYGISELANYCRNLREPLRVNDQVQWRRNAIEPYWRNFILCLVDSSLRIPFTYERNSHLFARCIACPEMVEPKTLSVFDINVDGWVAMAHHMQTMTGVITKVAGTTCCVVQWENDVVVHLPRTALRRVANLNGPDNKAGGVLASKKPLTSTTSVR